jgi:hypothetical protein
MSSDNAVPKFSLVPELQAFASEQAGRPIYKDVEIVEIYVPGDKHSVVSSLVTDEHRTRWPEQYRRFKAETLDRDQIVGTRLSEAPGIASPAQIKDLEYFNVWTVEALASLTDNAKQAIGPGSAALVAKAKAYLDNAKDNAAALAAAAQAERAAQENAELKAQLADLARQLAEMRAAPETAPEPTSRRRAAA